jgi:outer membrane protein assembly factor BamA
VVGQNQDFMYFRGNIELAGFLFWLLNEARGRSGTWSLFDIPYSQFARFDVDYRYYTYFKKGTSLAMRVNAGIGLPLTNKNSLPFEKYFYLGGSNSMRGWRLRTLGPGSYDEGDTVRTDNIGDIGLELNLEYRFPIYKYLKGALFVDAGNVWLRKENPLYPGGNFEFNRFYKEIAVDAGAGIRIDFDFLLIRLDGAIPLKEPRMPEGQRWIFENDRKFKIYGNLGIGYPF